MSNIGYLIFIIFILSIVRTSGQSTDFFIINEIEYSGNEKTAIRIIENELNILPGDTLFLENLERTILENEKRLLSTGLFTLVDIEIKNWKISSQKSDISIIVQENWYIYPSLIFELADRNFNVWWTEQNRSFDRVNYGISLDHINLTGHRDKLKIKFQRGYTHKYEANYKYPYISRRWGMNGEIFYSTNKEIGYITQGNKTLFRKSDNERTLLKRFRTGIGINFRQSIYSYHEWKLEFHKNSIDDIVEKEYNPDYFLDGKTQFSFFLFKYLFQYDRRIFTLYPEGGYSFEVEVKKEGLGIFGDFDNLSVAFALEKYIKLNDNLVLGNRIKGKTNLIRNKIAFANNTGLGYRDDLVRGYELYVIDGTDWVFVKTNFRWKIFEKLINLKRYMPLHQLKRMSTRLYLRFNLETGYVNEPEYKETNFLNNRWLLGYGPALDIVIWNTALFSMEYSFNHLGENNLFLSTKFNF